MASKARLEFKPIDYAYQSQYGIMPDYDFTNRLKAGQSPAEVSALIEKRMADIWARMKYEHEHEEELAQLELEKECPWPWIRDT